LNFRSTSCPHIFKNFASPFSQLAKQKIHGDKQRITVLPTICTDPNFKFPLQVISKLLGKKWKGGVDEEVQIGQEKVFRRNFGDFKARYRSKLK